MGREEVNYLTNDVENILIGYAFKNQKLTDERARQEMAYPYMPMYGNYAGYGSAYGGYSSNFAWCSGGYQQGNVYQNYSPQQPIYTAN